MKDNPFFQSFQLMMTFNGRSGWWLLGAFMALSVGCEPRSYYLRDEEVTHYRKVATEIAYPDVHEPSLPAVTESLPPHTLTDPAAQKGIRELTLREAIRIALENSKVIRDLGGRVVRTPDAAPSIYEPAIRESDPRFGVEAALAAFDTNLNLGITWGRNDRALNNSVIVGGVPTGIPFLFQEDSANFRAELAKVTAVGTQVALRNTVDYRFNNVVSNVFPSAYNTALEFEVRQPLLQRFGAEFNRIAGPAATPGFFFSNGVVLARINTDIAIADFEAAVRDFLSQVEDTYWELYFAYRDLSAQVAARDRALETWRQVYARFLEGAASAGDEAQAREQYYTFQAAVEATIGGSATFVTETSARGGLYGIEANLRRLMGLPVNDGQIIRPADEPTSAPLLPDWPISVAEALTQRVELRRQKWQVKRRELELVAAKNFLLPQLDLTALYRINGFGDKLLTSDGDNPRFQNAFETLSGNDFTDWQLGLQLNLPIGFRQAWTAVHNAELRLARERAVLKEQELQITHDLAGSVRALDSAYQQMQTHYNRLQAAGDRLDAQRAQYDAGLITLDVLLEAQEFVARAESAYYRSLVDYNISLKQLQFEKGTLLPYNNVLLAEGPWPSPAYEDAYQRERERANARPVRVGTTEPPPFVELPGVSSLAPGDQEIPSSAEEISDQAGPAFLAYPDAEVVPSKGMDLPTTPDQGHGQASRWVAPPGSAE